MLRVINAIAWTEVDLEFGNTVRQIAVAAGIAMYKAINTNLNARPTCAVFQCADPISIDLSLLDTHGMQCSR